MGRFFVLAAKKLRSEDYFLTDCTDNTDDKNVYAANARMVVHECYFG
jgi:hypothetical protein